MTTMKIIPLAEFITKAETRDITDIFSITINSEKRVYGIDSSYDFTRASQGKIRELVYAVIP